MDLLFSILLKACHRAMLNISSQSVGNDTGLSWGASGKCATPPCHVQRDRAPLQIIFLSQLSTFLIALVSLCALEQAVCRSTGISERDSEDRFTLTFRSHHGRLAAPAHRQP
jgi:hypothetical protein